VQSDKQKAQDVGILGPLVTISGLPEKMGAAAASGGAGEVGSNSAEPGRPETAHIIVCSVKFVKGFGAVIVPDFTGRRTITAGLITGILSL